METIEQKYRRYLEHPDQFETESRKAVEIDLDDCLSNMLHQASEYLLWSQLASIADSQSDSLKQHFEALSAECREKAYEKLSATGEKATDQRTKDVALRDPAIQSHIKIRKQADLFAQKLKCVQFALQQRKDMLIQVGYRQKAELGFYPKDQEYRRPDLRTFEDTSLEDLKQRALDAIEQ